MKSPIIVGPRCCGKTARSEALAERLVIPFVDADKIFEANYGTVTSFTTQQMKKYIDKYNSSEDFYKKVETLVEETNLDESKIEKFCKKNGLIPTRLKRAW